MMGWTATDLSADMDRWRSKIKLRLRACRLGSVLWSSLVTAEL